MGSLTRLPVLLINASHEPLKIIFGKRALSMVVKGVVEIELERDYDVRPGLRMPSVVRLRRYVRLPHSVGAKVLSRKNIYLRDGYRCQYCGEQFPGYALSWDHVIPRCQGGSGEWENLVAACKPCNSRKAGRTPEEAGMKLLRRPLPRTLHTGRFILKTMGSGMPEWDKYLFNDSTGETRLTRRA